METQSYQSYKTGELLVKEGLIHPDDVETALAIQEKRKASVSLNKSRLLGMILCDLNLITPIDNYVVLHRYNKLISLPAGLVQKGEISLERMRAAEAASLRQDLPLISLLLKTNTISTPVMQQILFDLFHIPFRSISDFIFNEKDRPVLEGIMDRQVSKENRIIPLVLKQNTLLFGITAPENLLLIHQLNQQFPQYRFKALFIAFSGFSWFHDIIYQGRAGAPPEKKQPDLSLLLAYKTIVNDPEKEKSAIHNLYHHYETLRRLLGHNNEGDRKDDFARFIQQAHEMIENEVKRSRIEFSFKKQGERVTILATPQEDVCQES